MNIIIYNYSLDFNAVYILRAFVNNSFQAHYLFHISDENEIIFFLDF